MSTYGDEAKTMEMQGELKRVEREYNQKVSWLKEFYQQNPNQQPSLEERLAQEKALYEQQLKEIVYDAVSKCLDEKITDSLLNNKDEDENVLLIKTFIWKAPYDQILVDSFISCCHRHGTS